MSNYLARVSFVLIVKGKFQNFNEVIEWFPNVDLCSHDEWDRYNFNAILQNHISEKKTSIFNVLCSYDVKETSKKESFFEALTLSSGDDDGNYPVRKKLVDTVMIQDTFQYELYTKVDFNIKISGLFSNFQEVLEWMNNVGLCSNEELGIYNFSVIKHKVTGKPSKNYTVSCSFYLTDVIDENDAIQEIHILASGDDDGNYPIQNKLVNTKLIEKSITITFPQELA